MGQGFENSGKGKLEVASESKGDKLSLTSLSDKNSAISSVGKGSDNNAAVKSLPTVDFVISKGQQENVFTTNGDMLSRKTNNKVDAGCSNSVSSSNGSEVRFDRGGLCKNIGDVKWGKSDKDGNMDITVGGDIKVQLNKNWDLIGVQSAKQSVLFEQKLGAAKRAEESPKDHAPKTPSRIIDMSRSDAAAQNNQPGMKTINDKFDSASSEVSKIDSKHPVKSGEPAKQRHSSNPENSTKPRIPHQPAEKMQKAPIQIQMPLDILPKQ